jgi:hypothetical protein
MANHESDRPVETDVIKQGIPCCPPLEPDGACDVLHWNYRLIHNTEVEGRRVAVEVRIRARLERCPGPLALGDLVYSTTLLPGEKVRLFTMDRRSQFTFDSASSLSYRNVQSSEESFYLSSVNDFMSDVTVRDEARSSSRRRGNYETHGETSGILESVFSSPSVDVSGSYSAESTSEFLRELSQHARASHRRSEAGTRSASSISIGEVQRRSHAEGETEDHFESSSRTFSNPNRCQAVTYLFYQINKRQTVIFTIESIRRRVIDPAADNRVTNNPFLSRGGIPVIKAGVLATDKERLEIEKSGRDSVAAQVIGEVSPAMSLRSGNLVGVAQPVSVAALSFQTAEPIPEDVRKQALLQVDERLAAAGLINEPGGQISEEVKRELSIRIESSLPTPGVLVKGCLDDCVVCEPARQEEISLDIKRKRLKNQLLERQIELLEKSQEYRCCPADEEEEESDD